MPKYLRMYLAPLSPGAEDFFSYTLSFQFSHITLVQPPTPHLHQVCCCTFILALFSLLFPRATHPSSVCVATSTHRPAVISYGLESKPKGREIKASHCSQRPPRSKGGYMSRLSLTHILDKSHYTSIQEHQPI